MGAKSGSSQGKAGQIQGMEIEEEGAGNPSQSGEAMDISQQASNDLNTSMEASSASNPATQGEATSTQGQEKEMKGDSDDEDWEEEEEEEEEEPDTLIKWIQTVHNLRWERHIECEIHLAHHKHLRNLKQATATEVGTASTNRSEILRREQELNEFYASQYRWKAQQHKNDITVQNAGYTKQFVWPKMYQPQGWKRSERKRKMQQEGTDQVSQERQDSALSEGESVEQRLASTEEDQMEEEKRQAVILEAQIGILKEQKRELEEDTTNLQKIAYAPHTDIHAAAKLHAKNSLGKRVLLPYRWNEGNSNWEVAIHRSLPLITTEDSNSSRETLRKLLTEDIPTRAYVVGNLEDDRED
ncbi:hypothetical protein CBR_g16020 [Chara braunii]|uniref:Uncharacterized protein n=1 Tax=Chara braunii TaxID=69332 RepID=A0A388JSZ0_CHABU|nr:hypothetical protein CBR_g16020 [Chara braunii]|eukprot:GBG60900.1 hypothetical protein CBR_g16020 [Chara braunii]